MLLVSKLGVILGSGCMYREVTFLQIKSFGTNNTG